MQEFWRRKLVDFSDKLQQGEFHTNREYEMYFITYRRKGRWLLEMSACAFQWHQHSVPQQPVMRRLCVQNVSTHTCRMSVQDTLYVVCLQFDNRMQDSTSLLLHPSGYLRADNKSHTQQTGLCRVCIWRGLHLGHELACWFSWDNSEECWKTILNDYFSMKYCSDTATHPHFHLFLIYMHREIHV